VPDSLLDAIPDAAGLRAVRAKVHAEASAVCPNCGRRHLLDSRCSSAPDVVHDEEPPPVEAPAGADSLHAHPFDATRDDPRRRARRLFVSVTTYLGLDSASFGEVDDDVSATAAGTHASGSVSPRPEDAPQPGGGPRRPSVQRIAAFLGFELGAIDRADATDAIEVVVATSSTALIASDDAQAEAEAEAEPEAEIAPVDPIATPESPIDVEAEETPTVTASDDAARHYWRRTDDDILYRPSRRPRSPRRAWRDRMASWG
jgi:hypothetical protein